MEESLIKTGTARMRRGAAFAALALLAVPPAGAQTQSLPRGAEKAPVALKPCIGAWDREKLGASRECTVTFGAEAALPGSLGAESHGAFPRGAELLDVPGADERLQRLGRLLGAARQRRRLGRRWQGAGGEDQQR